MPDAKSDNPAQHTSVLGCLLRLVWMLVGNAVLLFSAIWIGKNAGKSLFCAVDVLYAAGLFAMVLSRYLDIRYFGGTKGTGEPATMNDWRRFALIMIVVALLAWGAAHGIAFALTK